MNNLFPRTVTGLLARLPIRSARAEGHKGEEEGRTRLCGGRTGITFQPCQHAEEEEEDGDDDRGGRIDMGALGNLPD